jgi:hypothetical protein
MARKLKPAVGAGGKKKKKKITEEDKREFILNHHNHGDKHFHDKVHQPKPIICIESKDDKLGVELTHVVEEEKKHHHHPRHRAHHEKTQRTVEY